MSRIEVMRVNNVRSERTNQSPQRHCARNKTADGSICMMNRRHNAVRNLLSFEQTERVSFSGNEQDFMAFLLLLDGKEENMPCTPIAIIELINEVDNLHSIRRNGIDDRKFHLNTVILATISRTFC